VSYITLPSSGGGISSVNTDGITLTGDGVATDIEILQVQTDGATITGDGTVSSPLSAVGGSSLGYAFINRQSVTTPPLVVPGLFFPALDNGDYVLEINQNGIVDIASGEIRFLVEGTYIMRCQMTFDLVELTPSNTEFIINAGLTEVVGPSPPPNISGTIHANIESNTPWRHTVQYEWMVIVSGGESFAPYLDITGGNAEIQMAAERNTNWTILQVSA